jgi:hypothetical protein
MSIYPTEQDLKDYQKFAEEHPLPSEKKASELAGPRPEEINHGPMSAHHHTEAELRELRRAYIGAGKDPAGFDRALAEEGITLAPEPDPAVVRAHNAVGVPLNPQPSDYRVSWPTGFTADKSTQQLARTHTEMTELAAAIGLSPELGAAFIQRLAEIGPAVSKMGEAELAAHRKAQEALGIRMAGGSKAEFARRAAKAKEVLTARGGDRRLAKALAGSPAFADAWILSTLGIHHDALAALAERLPKKE